MPSFWDWVQFGLQSGIPQSQVFQWANQQMAASSGPWSAFAGSLGSAPGGFLGGGYGYGFPGGYGGYGALTGVAANNPWLAALPLLGGLGELATTAPIFNLQEEAAKIGMNPAELSTRINQLTQPLSKNLIHSVERDVNPSIAARGLATSPGMAQEFTAEALAPYELQEQQLGQNAVFQGLSLPFSIGAGAAGIYPQLMTQLPTVIAEMLATP